MTITCGIQPTCVDTIAMKVLYNSCKMYFHELLDMNAFSVMLWTYIRANPMPMLQPLLWHNKSVKFNM